MRKGEKKMENQISIRSIIKKTKTIPFVLGCNMEMGYGPGLPMLQIRSGNLCLLIPYLKYKTTGKVDRTLVYPIRYTVCVRLPDGKPVGFEDLTCDPRFELTDLSKPVGLFRHESIKNLSKKEYSLKEKQLYELYDKVANMLLYDAPYNEEDEAAMSGLLRLLITPELLPMYRALDRSFYDKYLG